MDAHAAGKIASFITVESGHSIGTSLGVLRTFQRLGVRALTLTHNCDTPWYVFSVKYIHNTNVSIYQDQVQKASKLQISIIQC